jgi:hypothetical protein
MADSQSLNRAGYGLYEKKDYAGAVRFFREAAYIDPAYVYPHYNLACSLSLLRDSIWADPAAQMDYHHNFNLDYYAARYQLYEPDDNYFSQIDNDEICRNEIFEHLTLACLLDRQYLTKAPADQDLAGLHNTLRFKRLMENIQSGKGTEIYGIWYSPQGLMKESYFMLDGSMSHILPNDRPKTRFVEFWYYEGKAINKIPDKDTIIQERSSAEYTFARRPTGYECFDNTGGKNYTNQWDFEDTQLIIYSQIIIQDSIKLSISPDASYTPENDYLLFKDILKVNQRDLDSLPLDNGNEYVNLYAVPYRFVMTDDLAALEAYLQNNETDAFNTLASVALIHDRTAILDRLAARQEVDLNRLFLLSCLYAKTELLTRLENGAYGFDVERFFNENDTILFKYASASGNATLFKLLYSKYYQTVINNLSDKKSFLQELISWHFITGDNQMYDLIDSIREGKYNGN